MKFKKNQESIFSDNFGQAEAVFRIMIDSVIGLAILLIILGALSYFDDIAKKQSTAELIQLIQSSASSPDGEVFVAKQLSFSNGFAIDSLDAQSWTLQSEKCFTFDSRSSAIRLSENFKRAEFTQAIKLPVYVQCRKVNAFCDPTIPPENEADCCYKCLISFGKEIKPN